MPDRLTRRLQGLRVFTASLRRKRHARLQCAIPYLAAFVTVQWDRVGGTVANAPARWIRCQYNEVNTRYHAW